VLDLAAIVDAHEEERDYPAEAADTR
jgi:hypothetical protein